MAKTKIEKIATIETEIKQLENQRKLLLQQHKEQERKARTRRLIERGAMIESLIPGAAEMANNDFMAYLQRNLKAPSVPQIPHSEPRESGIIAQQNTSIGAGQAV